MAERAYQLSTDSSGLFGSAKTWEDVYGFCKKDKKFLGFEMIGVKWMDLLLYSAYRNNWKVLGLHGRMGGSFKVDGLLHKAQLAAVGSLILADSKRMFGHFAQTPGIEYINLHSPELRSPRTQKLIKELPANNLVVYGENHSNDGGLGEAIDTIWELRANGLDRVYLMSDLAHYHNELTRGKNAHNIDETMERIIQKLLYSANLKDPLGRPILGGLHIPIGSDPDDSLPVDRIKDYWWEKFADTLSEVEALVNTDTSQLRVVLENQTKHKLRPGRSARIKQRERNKRIIGRLKHLKVL